MKEDGFINWLFEVEDVVYETSDAKFGNSISCKKKPQKIKKNTL